VFTRVTLSFSAGASFDITLVGTGAIDKTNAFDNLSPLTTKEET
jgi:hypothetical protein